MATYRQTYNVIRNLQRSLARYFGVDVATASTEARALAASQAAALTVIVKALVDNGVVTDGQMNAAAQAAIAAVDSWDPEPIEATRTRVPVGGPDPTGAPENSRPDRLPGEVVAEDQIPDPIPIPTPVAPEPAPVEPEPEPPTP
jgi:hypothetical protein